MSSWIWIKFSIRLQVFDKVVQRKHQFKSFFFANFLEKTIWAKFSEQFDLDGLDLEKVERSVLSIALHLRDLSPENLKALKDNKEENLNNEQGEAGEPAAKRNKREAPFWRKVPEWIQDFDQRTIHSLREDIGNWKKEKDKSNKERKDSP